MDASCARRAARVVVSVLLTAVAALVIAPQSQAITVAGGTVTVTVSGPGTVTAPAGITGSDGINCSQGGSTTSCSELYPQECDGSGLNRVCTPAEVTLSASTPTGYTLDWGGACDGETTTTCSVSADGAVAVSATYVDSQPPSVNLTSPAAGAVRGSISLAA